MDYFQAACRLEKYLHRKGFKITDVETKGMARILEEIEVDEVRPKGTDPDIVYGTKKNIELLRQEICKFNKFGRPIEQRWKPHELKQLKTCFPFSRRAYIKLRDYYNANIPEHDDYRRKTIYRLLQYWPGEMDRAKEWKDRVRRSIETSTPKQPDEL